MADDKNDDALERMRLERPAEYSTLLAQIAVMRLGDDLRGLLDFLRGSKLVDVVDWTWEPEISKHGPPEPPAAPRLLVDRWALAWRNYRWLMRSIVEREEKLRAMPQLRGTPFANETLAILCAVYSELSEAAPVAEFESFHSPSNAISRLKSNLRHARRVADPALALAVARLAVDSDFGLAEWSPFLPRKQWLEIFRKGECEISEDTFDRRTGSDGPYRRHPACVRGQISLDLRTLPPDVAAQHRTYAARAPQSTANGE